MTLRYFALVFGIVFALAGVAGFVPGLATTGPDGYDRLFGLFAVNPLHNLVHLAFGVWGLAAYRAETAARLYARSVAIIYGVIAVLGLVPATMHVFGLMPIHGHDVWLHAALAAVTAVFGWAVHHEPTHHAAAH